MSLNCDLLLEEACLLAGYIRHSAHEAQDGSLLWFDSRYPERSKKRPIGPHLYNGSAGIAFFLAAMEHITGGAGLHREVSLRAVAPLRRSLSHLVDNPASAARLQFKLGGMIGLGGYIYSFVRIGKWLNEETLIVEAHRVASLITPDRISQDRHLDVAHGSAGALLSLLLLDSLESGVPSDPTPLELARLCGEHLLSQRISAEGHPPAWPWEDGNVPLCGFSHGAAGIAYSLMRLFERTGDERFFEAASGGLDFERSHYNPEVRNWPDLRYPDHSQFKTAWCHGAPGIALSRLGMLHIICDSQIRDEIDDAIATTRSHPPTTADFLCCGNTGRIETLLYADAHLGNPIFREDADAIASGVLARSLSNGGRYGWIDPSDDIDPTLLVGAAGIGYTWLRMLAPSLPSLLVME